MKMFGVLLVGKEAPQISGLLSDSLQPAGFFFTE